MTTRVITGPLLFGLAMSIFVQTYFFLWNVFPALASLAEGLDLRFPTLAVGVINLWVFLGWPVVIVSPVIFAIGFLPERLFPRVAVLLGLTLFVVQILHSCFFLYMYQLGQSWYVLALQRVSSHG